MIDLPWSAIALLIAGVIGIVIIVLGIDWVLVAALRAMSQPEPPSKYGCPVCDLLRERYDKAWSFRNSDLQRKRTTRLNELKAHWVLEHGRTET